MFKVSKNMLFTPLVIEMVIRIKEKVDSFIIHGPVEVFMILSLMNTPNEISPILVLLRQLVGRGGEMRQRKKYVSPAREGNIKIFTCQGNIRRST